MGERKQKRKQRERLVELANELKQRELEISRKSQTIDELKLKLGDRERQIAAAEAAEPVPAHPAREAERPSPLYQGKPIGAPASATQNASKPVQPYEQQAFTPAESSPQKPSAEIVAEINEVLKSIFWDYSHSVHEISSQISTVTAAALCAAVTCILENRSFDIKDVFVQEVQKILGSSSFGAAIPQQSETVGRPAAKPTPQRKPADPPRPEYKAAFEPPDYYAAAETVKQPAPASAPKPQSWQPPIPAPEPLPELHDPDAKREGEQTWPSVSVPAPESPRHEEDILRIGSVIEFQKLGDHGFRNDETIVRVELPEGIQYLPSNYFYGCGNLKEVWLPNSLLEIGSYSFYGCKSLVAVHIGEEAALREIGEYAFAMCEKLISFTVPSRVEIIGTSAFRFCSSLEEVLISVNSMLRTIGSHLFHSCTSLDKILLPDSVTVIPTSMCYGCLNLREVVAKGVDTIEDYAFSGNKNLRSVSIRNMKTIAPQAFEDCSPDLEIDYTLR